MLYQPKTGRGGLRDAAEGTKKATATRAFSHAVNSRRNGAVAAQASKPSAPPSELDGLDFKQLCTRAAKAEAQLRDVDQTHPPIHPSVVEVRNQLAEIYKVCLLNHYEEAKKSDTDGLLWKNIFYKVIEFYRISLRKKNLELREKGVELEARNNGAGRKQENSAKAGATGGAAKKDVLAAEMSELSALSSNLQAFLAQASTFFLDLIRQLQQKHSLPLDASLYSVYMKAISPPPLCDVGGADQSPGPSSQTERPESYPFVHPSYWSCHRYFIYLGDIARYHKDLHQLSGGDWMIAARRYYKQALSLLPHVGNPHNQLGVLALYEDDELESLYQYYRCMCTRVPFPTGPENVATLFEKNGVRVAKLVAELAALSAEKSKFKRKRQERALRPDPAMLLSSYFVRAHGQLYSGKGMDDLPASKANVFKSLESCLKTASIDHNLLLKFIVVNVAAVQLCEERRSQAALFAVEFFAKVIRSYHFIGAPKTKNEVKNNEMLAALSIHLEWLFSRKEYMNCSPNVQPRPWVSMWKSVGRLANYLKSLLLSKDAEESRRLGYMTEEIELMGFVPLELSNMHWELEFLQRERQAGRKGERPAPAGDAAAAADAAQRVQVAPPPTTVMFTLPQMLMTTDQCAQARIRKILRVADAAVVECEFLSLDSGKYVGKWNAPKRTKADEEAAAPLLKEARHAAELGRSPAGALTIAKRVPQPPASPRAGADQHAATGSDSNESEDDAGAERSADAAFLFEWGEDGKAEAPEQPASPAPRVSAWHFEESANWRIAPITTVYSSAPAGEAFATDAGMRPLWSGDAAGAQAWPSAAPQSLPLSALSISPSLPADVAASALAPTALSPAALAPSTGTVGTVLPPQMDAKPAAALPGGASLSPAPPSRGAEGAASPAPMSFLSPMGTSPQNWWMTGFGSLYSMEPGVSNGAIPAAPRPAAANWSQPPKGEDVFCSPANSTPADAGAPEGGAGDSLWLSNDHEQGASRFDLDSSEPCAVDIPDDAPTQLAAVDAPTQLAVPEASSSTPAEEGAELKAYNPFLDDNPAYSFGFEMFLSGMRKQGT